MEFTEEEVVYCLKQVTKHIPFKKAWGASVAILIQIDDKLVVQGSGTLLAIAEERFVITASHIFDGVDGHNLYILPAEDKLPLPYAGPIIRSPKEKTDVAAINLSPEISNRIAPERFLSCGDVCFGDNFNDALFVVFGYPSKMAVHKDAILKLHRFHYQSHLYEGPTDALENYNPAFNFLLVANLDESRTSDGKPMEFNDRDGNRLPFPGALGGISGGSVWRIARDAHEIVKGTAEPKLVGVEHSVYARTGLIKSTWWIGVIHLFWHMRPDLRAVLEMYRGD